MSLRLEMEIIESMKDIPDSLFLGKDFVIASGYGSDERYGLNIELVTRGRTSVIFDGKKYTDIKDFPEELKEIIRKNPRTSHPDDRVLVKHRPIIGLFFSDNKPDCRNTDWHSLPEPIWGKTAEEIEELIMVSLEDAIEERVENPLLPEDYTDDWR